MVWKGLSNIQAQRHVKNGALQIEKTVSMSVAQVTNTHFERAQHKG